MLVLFFVSAGLLLFFFRRSGTEKNDESDYERFSRTMEHFSVLEEIAMDAMQPSDSLTKQEFLIQLKKTALVDWTECVNLMDEAREMKLSPALQALRADLVVYSNHRIQETLLYIRANEEGTNKYNKSIDSIQRGITALIDVMKVQHRPTPYKGPSRDL